MAATGSDAAVQGQARARSIAIDNLPAATPTRADDALRYRGAYNRYVGPAAGIDYVRIGRPYLLASDGTVHVDQDPNPATQPLEAVF